MKTKLIIGALCLFLGGCLKQEQATVTTSNGNIQAELLFENEGVKVWRFMDGGRPIYYTDARGAAEWQTSHSNGKSSTTVTHSVPTYRP